MVIKGLAVMAVFCKENSLSAILLKPLTHRFSPTVHIPFQGYETAEGLASRGSNVLFGFFLSPFISFFQPRLVLFFRD
jgi:hypothetical protein